MIDHDQLGQAAIGLGVVVAAVYNGYQAVQARRHAAHAADLAKANADKVAETHAQITVNGHKSDTPTLLDRVDRLNAQANEARLAVVALGAMLEGHLDLSAADRAELWEAVDQLRKHRGEGRAT